MPGGVDEIEGRPEHQTRFDAYSRARQHDLLVCGRRDGKDVLVAGIEAKACEDFAGVVADRAGFEPPSNKRARCNLLSQALFGREVLDEESGEILDEELSGHGYQLWTAAVGTIVEAQRHQVDQAVLVVHQFVPRDLDAAVEAGDRRDWRAALTVNAERFNRFTAAIEAAGSTSHQTEFVDAGTALHVIKVESTADVVNGAPFAE